MAKRTETSAPDGIAGKAASRSAPPRRGGAVLAHGVTMWAMDPRSSRRTKLYRNYDFARTQPVSVPEAASPPVVGVAGLSRAGAEILMPARH